MTTRSRATQLTAAWLALAALALGACSSSSGSGEGDDPQGAPSASESAPPKPTKVTLAMTGDVLLHNTVWGSAAQTAAREGGQRDFDFRPMFAAIKPAISGADIGICHMEPPIAREGGPYESYPLFSVPPQIAPDLKAIGYDACSTASNHSVDQGFDGVESTLDALDEAGLKHTGTARTPEEAKKIAFFEKQGMKIGWLSYTFGTNGMPVDSDKPWSVNLIDADRIIADAKRARAEGADAVLVALHWGDEYTTEPSAYQTEIAEQLTKSKAITMVYGHHAHVVQEIGKVNGKWVVYGLGNIVGDQEGVAPGTMDGLIAVVTLSQLGDAPAKVVKLSTIPTHFDMSAAPHGEAAISLSGPPKRQRG
ncbi:CapA family protein [Nocardioides speluncae]|uniref:CapA family protein n=1 Tax=Nocardioides speluncae TaxID=2670337 RepID=UPI0012B16D9D|nr:CapA family protein [Nocardioides speluncae]